MDGPHRGIGRGPGPSWPPTSSAHGIYYCLTRCIIASPVTLAMPHFQINRNTDVHIGAGKTRVKFEVYSFNCFGAASITDRAALQSVVLYRGTI